ncbi:MAG: hypothetical protein M3N25_03425 [Actinomycetota bacterium]|nr:hypothetical protein [Actinomycetota bacterium]
MNVEERLRTTLARRAEQVELSSDAWDRIRARTQHPPRRPRRVLALAMATAVVAMVLAATWLLADGPGPEVPVTTDEGTSTTQAPTTTTESPTTTTPATTGPTTTARAAAGGEPVVAANLDGGWRLVVGRRDGGACPQVHPPGEPFDPTFCGAYEPELQHQPVALGFGGADEGTPGPSFGYGMARPEVERVRLELNDGRNLEAGTIGHASFPGVRFFAVALSDEPGFNGVEAVVALGAGGEEVGRVDTSGRDDV